MKRHAALSWLLLWAACAPRCSPSCASSDELAELTSRSGDEIDRDQTHHEGDWRLAKLGDRFRVGDGLRTGRNSTANLALLPSGLAHVEPSTLLRFLADVPENPNRQLAVETGTVEIIAEKLDIEVHTPLAITKVAQGGRLKLSTTSEGHERFDLLVGRVVVAHEGIESTLAQGHPLELDAHEPSAQRTVDRAPASLARPAADDASLASNQPPPEPKGSTEPVAAAPRALPSAADDAAAKHYELGLAELASSTIHVAEPPIALLIPAPECADQLHISVDGAAVSSDARGGFATLGTGLHRIRVQCANRLVSDTQLRVKRDAAKMDLPKRAQEVRVEADGRRYTVRYQNLLPSVTFAWPTASGTGPFTLVIRKDARETSSSLDRPAHAFPSGALGEGEYKFWFRDGEGRSSASGTLRLSFDNTARSAYLSSPADGSDANAGVEVSGAALLRSQVSVQGSPVTLDEKGRFHTYVENVGDANTLSVRVEHPESGVHYYVRRLR